MQIKIVNYETKYRQGIEECVAELAEHLSKIDPLRHMRSGSEIDTDKYFEALKRRTERAQGTILVALKGEEVVGYGAGEILKLTGTERIETHPHRHGFLLDLVVRLKYRGKGIGAKIIKAMEEYFKKIGCSAMELECMAKNKNSYAFYKKMGYRNALHRMVRKIK